MASQAREGSGIFAPFVFLGTNHTVLCVEARNPDKVVWKRDLPSGSDHDTNVFFYNDVLYAGCNGNVYALNPETGNSLWEKTRAELDFYHGLPDFSMFEDTTLVAVCSARVVCLDAKTGEIKLNEKNKKSGTGYGTHYVEEDRVYTLTSGSIYCRNLRGMEEIWKNTFSMQSYNMFSMFRVKLKGAHEEDTLVVGTTGKVITLDRDTGEVRRKTGLKGIGYNVVTVVHNTFDPEQRTVFAGSQGKFFCLDIATHEIKWQNPLKGCSRDFAHSIVLWEDHADALPTYDDAINMDDEDGKGEKPETETFVTVEHLKLVILGMNGQVIGLVPETGEMVYRTKLKGAGSGNFTGFVLTAGLLHVGVNGKYFQVNPRNGECLARVPLKGVGYSPVCISTTSAHYDMNSVPLTQYRFAVNESAATIAAVV